MEIVLDCACGGKLAVHEGQAGLRLPCPQCREEVRVPSLGDLRKQNGVVPTTNPVFEIAARLRSGELPLRECAGCAAPAQWEVPLVAECERASVESNEVHWIWLLFAPRLFFWMPGWGVRATTREYGRDTVVKTPITLCDSCCHQRPSEPGEWGATLSRACFTGGLFACLFWLPAGAGLIGVAFLLATWQHRRMRAFRRRLSTWFGTVPAYTELRKEYPRLVLHLGADPRPLAQSVLSPSLRLG